MYKTAIFHNFQVPEKKTCFTNMDEVKKYIYEYNHPIESIGFDNQIKPVFDIDLKIEKNFVFEENTSLSKWCQIIKKMFEAAAKIQIYILKRPSREFNGLIKHSYHIIVDGIRISHGNLKKLVKNAELSKEWDTCIYSDKRGLYPIYSSKKFNRNTGLIEDVSMFKPYDCFDAKYLDDDKIDITKYLPSYIEEDFIDWDEKMKIIIEKKLEYKSIQSNDSYIEDEEVIEDVKKDNVEDLLYNYINVLSSKRATDYDTWRDVVYAITNICKRFDISNRKRVDLIHAFSQKSKNYEEKEVDKWLDTNKFAEKGYGWNFLKHTCVKEDDPEFHEENCGASYSMVKRQFEKDVGKCMNPVGFIRVVKDELLMNDNPEPIQFLSKEKLITAYEEWTFFGKITKRNKTHYGEIPFLQHWFKDKKKACYERIVFKPYHLSPELSKKYYNIYDGLRAELLPVNKDYTKIQPILDHIKNILVSGNEAHYKWLIQYFAQIIQKPEDKTGVGLIFHGKQGCGKNIIVDAFANGILGKKLSISTANPERTFFGNFNGCTMNKILGVCNEVGNEVYNCMDKLKDLITAPDVTNEKKGVDRIIVENYINIIMTTNNTNPLNISTDDRRLVWFDCADTYIGNGEYFDVLSSVLENDECISAFYHYLKEEVKIEITNFQKNRPITKGYKRVQKLNLPSYVRWLGDKISKFQFRKYKDVMTAVKKRKEVYDSYKKWCDTNKYTALKRDTFLHHLESDGSGISRCVQKGIECLRFNEADVIKWLDKQGLGKSHNDDIEEITWDFEEEDD